MPDASTPNAPNPLFDPDSPIMRPRSFNRAQNSADVAIPLIAAGGCRAVSTGVLARHLGVTPAATMKWFGSTARMWEQLSDVIGDRWLFHLDLAARLETDDQPAPSYRDTDIYQAVSLLLPLNQHEIEWARVWLALLELGRHQELAGRRLARVEGLELDSVSRATTCRDIPTLTATMVVVRGLRHMVAATHSPLDLGTAHELMRRHVTLTYVDRDIPEPIEGNDVGPFIHRLIYGEHGSRPLPY